MPGELKKQIIQMNEDRSQEFRDTIDMRREYRREHPTEIAATMCMDGRVNLAVVCELPFGIITPFRNIGGYYDLGWPLLRDSFSEFEKYAYRKRRLSLLIVTYHWSAGDTHRGCAGFKYDTEGAKQSMIKFKDQVDRCYAGRMHTILVGLETDSEALVVHGEDGQILDMREQPVDISLSDMTEKLKALLPSMSTQVVADFANLLLGNVRHIQTMHNTVRELNDYKHRERVLAIGQGFDWLVNRNFALIIGPCDPNLTKPIVTAASIIQSNLREGRISDKGGVLLVSTPYRFEEDRLGAIEQSRYLASLAKSCIAENIPDMANFFEPMVGVLEMDTRQFEAIE